jgi:hypothetical protein
MNDCADEMFSDVALGLVRQILHEDLIVLHFVTEDLNGKILTESRGHDDWANLE